MSTAQGSQDRAAVDAAGAASYWRGRRVRQEEELNLPSPEIEIGENGSMTIEYNGYELVQECLEYYVDKSLEAKNQQRVYEQEFEALKERRNSLEQHRPRAVLVYLLMENADRSLHLDLALSLRCLAKFFWHYPVVIFHSNSSSPAELRWLSSAVPEHLKISFEEVSVGFPSEMMDYPGGPDAFLKPPLCMLDDQYWWLSDRSCGCRCPAWRPQCWPVNWMHAAHFFTAGMFRTKTFQQGGYDYFFRVDTDLFFVEAPVVDPFKLMAEMGCLMVYDKLSREAPGCYDDFDLRSSEFLEDIRYVGRPDLDVLLVGKGPAAAGGQWTIGDARFFTSDLYLKFADYMVSGIYAHRWSEQIILLRSAALFGPRADLRKSLEDAPAVSLCTTPLFPEGTSSEGGSPGLVHLKGGFRQQHLLKTCAAEGLFP
ncbi:unnamed protein product [Cladocopium goreaui]|uniref:Nucleotide-diphospho-sugar transferase domain-containing protein n=1 Tax=Cladocopium goreaui TaxID=2562237 RepID=A0A9P1M3M8_9DINO|nr:unnamed protein product [Cladocopium goreaui]